MDHYMLTISGINHTNFDNVHRIVSDAGYAGSMQIVDECTRFLDIGNEQTRLDCDIKDWEIHAMVSSLVLFCGCTVQAQIIY